MRLAKKIATATVFCGSPLAAQPIDGLQNHAIQTMYWTAPCTETIAQLDIVPDPALGMRAMVEVLALQGVAWGHLLGFESAHPGIRGTHETTLMRLRADCAAYPNATAMELLQNYAAE